MGSQRVGRDASDLTQHTLICLSLAITNIKWDSTYLLDRSEREMRQHGQKHQNTKSKAEHRTNVELYVVVSTYP